MRDLTETFLDKIIRDEQEKARVAMDKKPDNSQYKCPRCQDMGYYKLVIDGYDYVTKCKCDIVFDNRINETGLPDTYKNKTFDNFHSINDSATNARKFCLNFISKYPNNPKGLLFLGSCGTGKTHLAAATIRALSIKGQTGMLFVDSREMLSEIKATFDKRKEISEQEVLEKYKKASILCIDDLGAEQHTEWTDSIFSHVINARYNKGLKLFITTNYMDAPRTGTPSLTDRIGKRSRSRLYEMCADIFINAHDYRRRNIRPN